MDQSQSLNQGDSERGLDNAGGAHKRQPSTLKTTTRVHGLRLHQFSQETEVAAVGRELRQRRQPEETRCSRRPYRQAQKERQRAATAVLQAFTGELLRSIVVTPSRFRTKRRVVALDR